MDIKRVLTQIEENLKRVRMFTRTRKKDGVIFDVPFPKRGNGEYAYQSGKKIAAYKQRFLQGIVDYSTMFITLVSPYGSSFSECQDSWRTISKATKFFTRTLKNKRNIKSFVVLEATKEGCCHCHLLVLWDRPLKAHNEKHYLAEPELLISIRKKWLKAWMKVSTQQLNKNTISIQVCPNKLEAERIFNYISKHLGFDSNIEKSLERARENKAGDSDFKKLFSNFWAFRLNIRLYRFSRNL